MYDWLEKTLDFSTRAYEARSYRAAVEAQARAQQSENEVFAEDSRYAVDEYGRAYLRGAPSAAGVASPLLGLSPGLIGVGLILAGALAFLALKR